LDPLLEDEYHYSIPDDPDCIDITPKKVKYNTLLGKEILTDLKGKKPKP